jgi:hypothetical protein
VLAVSDFLQELEDYITAQREWGCYVRNGRWHRADVDKRVIGVIVDLITTRVTELHKKLSIMPVKTVVPAETPVEITNSDTTRRFEIPGGMEERRGYT